MNKKIISFLFLLTFLACILSVTASAAPYHPGWQDNPFRSPLEGRLPVFPDSVEDMGLDSYTEEDFQPEELPFEDTYVEEESFDPLSEDMNPSEEDLPALPEETPESIEAAKELAAQIQPDGPVVVAVSVEESAPDQEPGSVTVGFGETYYAREGLTVFNDGGTVYSNFCVVYNNGGLVYANDSIVYNNAGTVYANGGTIYNNAGEVFSNAAIVFGFDNNNVTESSLQSAVFLEGATPKEGSPVPEETVGWEEMPAIFPDSEEPDDMRSQEDPMMASDMDADVPFDDPAEDDMNPMYPEDPMADSDMTADVPFDYPVDDDMYPMYPEDPMMDSEMTVDDPFDYPADDDMYSMYPEDPMNDYYDYSVGYEDLYAPVFDTYLAFLNGESPTGIAYSEAGDEYFVLGETGISPLSYSADVLGYCLLDIDGNGIPELLIGSLDYDYSVTEIFDMFTLIDDVPCRVLASNGQCNYQLTEDDLILYENIQGSEYDFAALFQLNVGDLELLTGVVRFQDETFLSNHCYQVFGDSVADYREDGEQEIEISEEEYQVIVDILEDSVVPFEINVF